MRVTYSDGLTELLSYILDRLTSPYLVPNTLPEQVCMRDLTS